VLTAINYGVAQNRRRYFLVARKHVSLQKEKIAVYKKKGSIKWFNECRFGGFCLFDSNTSNFTSAKCAAKRDYIAEYADALHKADLGVGFYYSLKDWTRPAYFSGPKKDPQGWKEFTECVRSQLYELCTHYGEVDIMWFDGANPYNGSDWQSNELISMVRELQPGILINDRSANDRSEHKADFSTSEQHIRRPANLESTRTWEACMTMNRHWGYNPNDCEWKTTTQLIYDLVHCASGNGNYLLNIGPDPEGLFPREAVIRLRKIGRWLQANGESAYGTQYTNVALCGPVHSYATVKENTLYVHVWDWPGSSLALGNLFNRVISVRFVSSKEAIKFDQVGSRVVLSGLPQYAPDEYDTVIALECDGVPKNIDRVAYLQ
jgi:alpha-L-fucosidase